MTQPHILELARQGDPQAIATLMNQSLQPRGMTATVERQDNLLEVVLEAERVPSREALTAFVQKGIANLGVDSIRLIRIVGQQTGAMLPAWMQELDLAIALPIPPDLAPPDPTDSAMQGQTAPSVGVESIIEEPLDLGAIASEHSALSLSESAEAALPESLPDTLNFEGLDFEGLDFEDQSNSREPLSSDPQQRHLEAQLESLWAEQSTASSQDYDLSLDADEPISEEEFQDLFAEDLSDPQDFFPSEFSGEHPTIEPANTANTANTDLSTDADMDSLFGERAFSPESSSDLAEYSFDLGTDESEPSAELSAEFSSDFFLNDPLDDSLNDSYGAIVELPTSSPQPDEEPGDLGEDLFASSPSLASNESPDLLSNDILISDVSISDISSFDDNEIAESEIDEIAFSEDLSQNLFSEESSDFSLSSSDESTIDAAIADLFVEDTPLESDFTEGITGGSENALDFPELDLPELDLPELDLNSESSPAFGRAAPPEVSHPGDSIADENQSLPSNLFTEELQGLNEAPIEYVFGEAIENPIAQNPSTSSATEDFATEDFATEDFATDELFAEPLPQRVPLPLLEEQLDNLWAEQGDSSFELEEEPLLSDEPVINTYDQPDFFGQPGEESLTFGSESDFLLESPVDSLPDRSDELDLSNPNAVLLDLPSDSLPPEDLLSEDLFSEDLLSEDLLSEDLLSESLLEPIAPEDFSLDLSDNPLDEQSDSLFQNFPQESSEDFFLDDTNSLAALSLDDLEEERNTSSDSLDLMEEDTFIDDALIDSAIASLPSEFLNDSFSEQFENPPETPLEIAPSAASADIDLSDFSDFSDNLPDEPLASLIHETSSDDLGIEFLADLSDETDLGLDMSSQPIESTLEAGFTRDSIPEDADLDLPLDFLDDRTTSSSLRYLPDDDLDNDLSLDDDFLNLPNDLLDYSADSPLENLFPEPSAPIDRQSLSMEDLMPSQSALPEDLFPEEAIDFLQEDTLTETDELPEDQAEPTGLSDWDEESGAMQGEAGLTEDDLAGSSLDNALDNDWYEDIGNLSLELDSEAYTDEDTSIASTFDEPWLDPLDNEVETNRNADVSPIELPVTRTEWDDLSTSSELSQAQLEAQLEEFDRNSASSENYDTGGNSEGYAEGNGQVDRRTPTVITTENSSTSWLLTVALVGMSGLAAGLLGYVLWSKVMTSPTPEPSITPAPVQPSVLPSAPPAVPTALPAAPPAEPAVPPSEPPVP